jgi:hypothetical protein
MQAVVEAAQRLDSAEPVDQVWAAPAAATPVA